MMLEPKSPRPRTAPSGLDQPGRVPLTTRLLRIESLTAGDAAAVIAGVTLLSTAAGGILERSLDHQEYPNIRKGPGSRYKRSPPLSRHAIVESSPWC